MRIALLGDHPDGFDFTRALTETGRHQLSIFSGPAHAAEYLARWGLQPKRVGDVEEILADPSIEAVVVAGGLASRAGQLRRALQSERHVVCVHPAADSPDAAFEAAMLQEDAKKLLFPLLAETLHPGIRRFAEFYRGTRDEGVANAAAIAAITNAPAKSSKMRTNRSGLLEIERWSTEEILLESELEAFEPAMPGWDLLRFLGGDIAEVAALSEPMELLTGEPILITGRFALGGLFQATYLPRQSEKFLRMALVGEPHRAQLVFPQGWPGPSRLTYVAEDGAPVEENWPEFNPWAALVAAWESALSEPIQAGGQGRSLASLAPALTWQDEIRGLELDDAARRAIERRRTTALDNLEASEEANFKSTMTLVGCGMLWLSLLLLILSAWKPWLGWFIVPIFGVFLIMQILRWIVPPRA